MGKENNEYLSGMKKTDKFIPVITLVVYYGEEKWDAAISLHELLEFGDDDERVQSLVENYRIHVFDYLEEGFSRDKIIDKLKKHFELAEDKAEQYFERFAS